VSGVFRVALVGYTNAGKSSLLNALTGADALAYDMLFATLDSTTRSLTLADGREITLTDTVGFINKLPHGLVEAFKSTLDEVREADLLLHVVDASHVQAEAQMTAVDIVLKEIEAVLRRASWFSTRSIAVARGQSPGTRTHPDAVLLSAATREGLEALLQRLAAEAARGSTTMTVLVPYTHGELVRLAHERTHLVSERHTPEGTQLVMRVPSAVVPSFSEYVVDAGGTEGEPASSPSRDARRRRARPSDAAEERDDLPEDRHVAHVDRFECRVLGLQAHPVGLLEEPLHRRVVSDESHDDVAVRCRVLLPDDDEVPVEDACLDHGVAPDAQDEGRLIGHLDRERHRGFDVLGSQEGSTSSDLPQQRNRAHPVVVDGTVRVPVVEHLQRPGLGGVATQESLLLESSRCEWTVDEDDRPTASPISRTEGGKPRRWISDRMKSSIWR
jgi:hypothetical protein